MRNVIKKVSQVFHFFDSRENFSRFKSSYLQTKTLVAKQLAVSAKNRRLLAVYDFLDLPYTSDFTSFMLNADAERRARKYTKVDIVIVTNSEYPADPTYQKHVNTNNYRNLIYNMAIEFTRLHTHFGSVMLLEDRQQAIDLVTLLKSDTALFPSDYNPRLPCERTAGLDRPLSYLPISFGKLARKDKSYLSLEAPAESVKLVRKWIYRNAYPKIPITITLRESSHLFPKRANDIEQWQKLIDVLGAEERFVFIVLRDYYNLYDEEVLKSQHAVYCNEAVISMSFRAALLQEVTLNLFIPNGVNNVATQSMHSRYIQFQKIINDIPQTKEVFVKQVTGLSRGDSWPGSSKFQKIVWSDDNFDVMKSETETMLSLIEKEDSLYPRFYEEYGFDNKLTKTEQCATPNDITTTQVNQSTLLSQRTAIQYYISIFHIKNSLLYMNYWFCKYIKGFRYKTLNSIRLKSTDEVLFYGAGTLTTKVINDFSQNVIGVVDRRFKGCEEEFFGVPGYPPSMLDNLKFDYLVITPQNRELAIIKQLAQTYKIKNTKFLVLHSDIYKP